MKPAIERIDLGTEELNQLLERARELLSEEDYRKLKAAVDTLFENNRIPFQSPTIGERP